MPPPTGEDYWDDDVWEKYNYECTLIPFIDDLIYIFTKKGYDIVHNFDDYWILVNVNVPEDPDENICSNINKSTGGKYDEVDYYDAFRAIFPFDNNEVDYEKAENAWHIFKKEITQDLQNNL